jgi:lipid-binding SYLF domain-containing protein
MGKALDVITTMEGAIASAVATLEKLFHPDLDIDKQIPIDLIHQAKGLAFLTVVKAGFVWTAKLGTGLVVVKLPDGKWSAPSAIGTAGIGWGMEAGGEMMSMLILLNSDEAVQSFMQNAQASTGANIEFAAGPYGRSAGANANISSVGIVPNYTYCHSKGLFGGVGLQGSALATRSDINTKFYERDDITPRDILSGKVEPPKAAETLYHALGRAIRIPSSGKSVFDNLRDSFDGVPEAANGEDADEIYDRLVEKVKSYTDQKTADLFKTKCKLYGETLLSDEDFIVFLEEYFNKKQLVELTPDIARLYADIDMRDNVYDLYKKAKDQVFYAAAAPLAEEQGIPEPTKL